ncbi:MAG: TolC family protein [Bryobacteraceae bacterium]|nr:TolC family protein [Bryobacteraceae bacterium]
MRLVVALSLAAAAAASQPQPPQNPQHNPLLPPHSPNRPTTVTHPAIAAPAASLPSAALSGRPALRLEDILSSVRKSYPPLLAALEERRIADGDLLVAEGGFDAVVRAAFENQQAGPLDNNRLNVVVDQPLAFQGLSFFGGYRLGEGRFSSSDASSVLTTDLGEYRTGLRLPLFRDRAIDSRRATLWKSRIGLRLADLSVDQQLIFVIQAATRRYWDWVAAGQRLRLAETILNVALTRDQQLKEAVRLGQLPQIEVTDNERAILTRRAQVVEARRGLEQASFELSLFYRDANGDPVTPLEDLLPPAFPDLADLSEQRVAEDVDLALKRRPEVLRLAAQRDQTRIDADLARNQTAPNIDLVFGFNQFAGAGTTPRGNANEVRGSLIFELPFQRRRALGAVKSAEARLAQFDQRERFARDQVIVEVRDAASAVRRAAERTRVLRDEVNIARNLEELERSRFDLGDSTLFLVNLREQATFDTAVREVSAAADYFRAYALYELAIAEALSSQPRPTP